jgi:hypothetical protein
MKKIKIRDFILEKVRIPAGDIVRGGIDPTRFKLGLTNIRDIVYDRTSDITILVKLNLLAPL